ncbi:MAG: YbaN family protein [Lachnospiraceae bacterium]|nr:YbaN family protein [Lachnospiraceae bacterium]MDD7026840.1 YbaN family protein [Lachnospiraceae bacterium]MDY5700546.1 YbaN family protein [Lachnospiraceae bacterium]
MKLKKIILIVVGCLSVALGTIGSVVPLLPTFPFLLLATVCFTNSSERLHTWFKGTRLYKNNLESYVKGEGMTVKTKVRILGVSSFFMAISFLALNRIPVGQLIVALIWVALLFLFIFGIKTAKADSIAE